MNFLKSWQRDPSPPRMRTFDFGTLYTTIPLADLVSKINYLVGIAARYANRTLSGMGNVMLSVAMGSKRATWERGLRPMHTKSSHVFSLSQVNELVRFVIHNAYVKNGNVIKKQLVGIPMGTNSGPGLANLYLYAYESSWVRKLEAKEIKSAQSFHLSFRLIDDLLSLDNPWDDDFLKKDLVYPSALQINETSEQNAKSVNFLGMTINGEDNKFWFQLYDKRASFPFPIVRYPDARSNIPLSMAWNVFTGQLHRFSSICSRRKDFIIAAVNLASTFLNKGYGLHSLKRRFAHFCIRTPRFRRYVKLMAWKFLDLLHKRDFRLEAVKPGA